MRGVGPASPWVGFFGSAGANNRQTHLVEKGGNLMVWDTWYEAHGSTSDWEPRYIHLTDSGNLTLFGGMVATAPSKDAPTDKPAIDLDGFTGNVVFLNENIDNSYHNPCIRLAGTGEGMKLLTYGTAFTWQKDPPIVTDEAPKATYEILASRPRTEVNTNSDLDFVRTMLAPARTVQPTYWPPAPDGATDLRVHRVEVGNYVGTGLTFLGGTAPSE